MNCYKRSFTPSSISVLKPNEIFVFGSNRSGYHVGGSAKIALKKFGAVYGQSSGLQGQSYGIVTVPSDLDSLRYNISKFIEFARNHPDMTFLVTKVGCGNAGFTPYDIAPLFMNALPLSNVLLPKEFVNVLQYSPRFSGFPVKTWNSKSDFLDKVEAYKKKFQNGDESVYEKIRQLRVSEFLNTVYLSNEGYYYTESGTFVSLDSRKSTPNETTLYSEEFDVRNVPALRQPTVIEVVERDCMNYASELSMKGFYPAVLNMASNTKPGGGVLKGSAAQEESIFRRTDLFRSLYQYVPFGEEFGVRMSIDGYPLKENFGGIYSSGISLFRESEPFGYKLKEHPVKLSFITVAAVKNPKLVRTSLLSKELRIDSSQVETVKNKIRTILRIGLRHRHDSLVLGAWGCGAYANPPRHIAELFRHILMEEEFKNKYRRITFAILDDHNTRKPHNPHGNLLPFKEVFSESKRMDL